jgi:hypothetical protein
LQRIFGFVGMMHGFYIYGRSIVSQGEVMCDGTLLYKNDSAELDSMLAQSYEGLKLNYPKYFKMDSLSKLAFLASEILLTQHEWMKDLDKESVSICMQTCHGSLDTDIKYQQTIANMEEYFPSPSIFVYTLPNVAMGEICIRNGFKGENLCLISPRFDIEMVVSQLEDWFDFGKTKICLLGWVDISGKKYSAEMTLLGKMPKPVRSAMLQ